MRGQRIHVDKMKIKKKPVHVKQICKEALLKVPILPRTAKKYTRSSNAGAELFFCPLNLLFASSSLPSPSWFTKGPYLQLSSAGMG